MFTHLTFTGHLPSPPTDLSCIQLGVLSGRSCLMPPVEGRHCPLSLEPGPYSDRSQSGGGTGVRLYGQALGYGEG